jgi:hypothetical protein
MPETRGEFASITCVFGWRQGSTIKFNLACYEAQMGNLDQAKANLERATRIDPRFRLIALEDPDLQPLWGSLAAASTRE